MDIKVYRFINSHAMTQIIFLSKTFWPLTFCISAFLLTLRVL